MNYYSDASIFAIVIAINLVLFGALLAGGLALIFRFIENAAPRGRYLLAIFVFVLAVLLPLGAALKAPISLKSQNSKVQNPPSKTIAAKTAETRIAVTDSAIDLKQENVIENYPAQPEAAPRAPAVTAYLSEVPENPSKNFFDDFVVLISASIFGKIFVGIWLAGTLLLLFREASGLYQLRKAQKNWQRATETERAALLCPDSTPLYFDRQQSPGTIGLWRPRIVLPAHFLQELSMASRRLILQHELSHACWHDPLINFLLRITRALFWISPALWLLERLIDSEREAAADQWAIRALSGESEYQVIALDYADTLMAAAREFNTFGRQNRRPQAIGFSSASELENRVRRLLLSSRTTASHIVSAIAACALTLAMIVVVPSAGLPGKFVSTESELAAAGRQPENSQTYFALNDAPKADLPVAAPTPPPVASNSENGKTNKSSASKTESRDKLLLSLPASSSETPATTETLTLASGQAPAKAKDFYNRSAGSEAVDAARRLSDEDARATDLKSEQPPVGLSTTARTFRGLSPMKGIAREAMTGLTGFKGNSQPLNQLGITSAGGSEATNLQAAGEADRRAAQFRDYPPMPARAETYRTPYTSGYSPQPLPSPPSPARSQP